MYELAEISPCLALLLLLNSRDSRPPFSLSLSRTYFLFHQYYYYYYYYCHHHCIITRIRNKLKASTCHYITLMTLIIVN
jgi:hypothetical protein